MLKKYKPQIDSNEVSKNIDIIMKIHSMLADVPDPSMMKLINTRLDIPKYDNQLFQKILKNQNRSNVYTMINQYKKMIMCVDVEPGPISNYIRFFAGTTKSMVKYESKNETLCESCQSELRLVGCETICPVCATIKRVSIIEVDDEEIRSKVEKKNVSKHYEETLKKIYGNKPKDNVIPDEVIEMLGEYLQHRKVDIRESLHYTYTLLGYMKEIGDVRFEGKVFKIKKYKNQVNYILLRLYPDLIIPTLSMKDLNILSKSFMSISSTFHRLNPNKYGNNYMYTIFKIIHLMMPYNPDARNLLRFIFIQKTCSFPGKDHKLKEVNDEINIFPQFKFTPEDIYGREDFYRVNVDD